MYKRQKSIFGFTINGAGLIKYMHTDGERIQVRMWINSSERDTTGRLNFANQDEYESWIDAHVSDEEWQYQKTSGLASLLRAMPSGARWAAQSNH